MAVRVGAWLSGSGVTSLFALGESAGRSWRASREPGSAFESSSITLLWSPTRKAFIPSRESAYLHDNTRNLHHQDSHAVALQLTDWAISIPWVERVSCTAFAAYCDA